MRVGLVRNVALGMVALVGLGLAGCDDNPTDFEPDETVRIFANPTVMTVPAGVTTLLQSRTENAGNEPTWEEISASVDGSCGSAAIAVDVAASFEPTIEPPGKFDVTGGTTLGETCIQLSGGGANATVEVMVVGDSLEITGAPDTLNLNSSVDLGAVLLSDDGAAVSPFSDATDVVWSSSDEAVMTVDGDGVVTAVGIGGAVITATWSEFGVSVEGSAVISTNEPTLEITGTPEPPELVFGTSVDLSADLINPTDPPADFGPFDPETDLVWSSSDDEIAEVDATTGEVTGVGGGTATITAAWAANENVIAEVEITITAPAPTLTSLDVASGPVATYVTITGTGLLAPHEVFVDGSSVVLFQDGDATATEVSFWMPNPGFAGPGTYDVQVGLAGDLSNALEFTLTSDDVAAEPDSPGAPKVIPGFPFTAVDYSDGDDLEDFYTFTLAADGSIDVTMEMDLAGDIDVYVADAPVAVAFCTSLTADNPEVITDCELDAGTYVVYLFNYSGAPVNYRLEVTESTP